MNNSMKMALIAAGAIVVIGLGVVVFQSGDDTPSGGTDTFVSGQQLPRETEPANTQQSAQEPVSSANYVKYQEGGSAIEDAAGTKRVVFFHASWCPICNAFEDDIERVGVPEGITIIQADFDDDRALKQQYGVTVQSTFVLLDDAGNVEMRWPFGQGLSGITDLYDQLGA